MQIYKIFSKKSPENFFLSKKVSIFVPRKPNHLIDKEMTKVNRILLNVKINGGG